MEQLIEMARRLGKQIAAHQRTANLKKARQAVNEDADAESLIKDYQKHSEKIQQLEKQQKPIEVADKHKLSEIEEKISTHPKLSDLMKCQADFVEMMHKINQAIDNELKVD